MFAESGRMKSFLYFVLFTVTALALLSAASCNNYTTTTSSPYESVVPNTTNFIDAPMTIDTDSGNLTVRTNLIKLVGNVSGNASTYVNDQKIDPNLDGTYVVFFDLKPGMNTIDIKTLTSGTVENKVIEVTFTPPLKVWLNIPVILNGVDYTKKELDIGGFVTNPLARVQVNGINARVASDGSFTANLLLDKKGKSIEALATFNDEMDADSLAYSVNNNRIINFIPGQQSMKVSHIKVGPDINIIAGEIKDLHYELFTGKDIEYRAECSVRIARVLSQGNRNEQPDLPGLAVDIKPSSLRLYPGIDYDFDVKLAADRNISEGDYPFHVGFYLDNVLWYETWVNLRVADK